MGGQVRGLRSPKRYEIEKKLKKMEEEAPDALEVAA